MPSKAASGEMLEGSSRVTQHASTWISDAQARPINLFQTLSLNSDRHVRRIEAQALTRGSLLGQRRIIVGAHMVSPRAAVAATCAARVNGRGHLFQAKATPEIENEEFVLESDMRPV
jgi:hypothetical protein